MSLCNAKKLSNEEKAWYGFCIEKGRGSIMGENWIYNKL